MTTQPKLPDWVEQYLEENRFHRTAGEGVPGGLVLFEEDARTLASRLLAEIVPEGYVVIPAKQLADLRHLAAYVGLAAKNTPFMPVGKVMEDAMRDIPDPGPAAEPCKNPNCKGGMLRVGENAWAYCPDCNCTETKVDPPGHAEYVAGKKEEGGGKCKCGDGGEICKRAFTGGLQGMTDVCINALNDGTICGHAEACHEGAKP